MNLHFSHLSSARNVGVGRVFRGSVGISRMNYNFPWVPKQMLSIPSEMRAEQDGEWNRRLFDTEKSAKLSKLFEDMLPCIKKCMLYQFGTPQEMASNYCRLYSNCLCIIMKHMRQNPDMPPSAFSAAVHSQVMQRNWHVDARWRVVCAVFEYTCMEIAGILKQREDEQAAVKEVLHGREASNDEDTKTNQAARIVYSWLHPDEHHRIISETHLKVHDTHSKVDELMQKIDALQKMIEKKRDQQ